MNKKDIIGFFDNMSKTWDDNLIIYDDKMKTILETACITEGSRVLDVACGTGVMVPYYLSCNVQSVTGIDISPKMIECAQNKFKDIDNVKFICSDADSFISDEKYDRCMIFNALPHFINPETLLSNLSKSIECNGRITVAHDMGRKKLDHHHSGFASKVSCGLISEDDLEKIFLKVGFHDVIKYADDDIYIVSAIK